MTDVGMINHDDRNAEVQEGRWQQQSAVVEAEPRDLGLL